MSIEQVSQQAEQIYNQFERIQGFIERQKEILSKANLGEIIDNVCRDIEKEVPKLEGVLINIKYNDKKKYPDDKL